jgi:hypothetical protein
LNKFELLQREVFGLVGDGAVAVIGKLGVAAKCKHLRELFLSLLFTCFFIKKHCVQRV